MGLAHPAPALDDLAETGGQVAVIADDVDLADPSWRSTALFFDQLPGLRRQFAEASGGSSLRVPWFPLAAPHSANREWLAMPGRRIGALAGDGTGRGPFPV